PAPGDELLEIAARKAAGQRAGPGCNHVELVNESPAKHRCGPSGEETPAGEGMAPDARRDGVVCQRKVEAHTFPIPVLRDHAQAHEASTPRGHTANLALEERHAPSNKRPGAHEHFGQLPLPVAFDSRNADDLACSYCEADPS